jgi:hypothetical protein
VNLISYTLFGPRGKSAPAMYTVGAIRNAEICADLYPGWLCRFHVGRGVDEATLEKLRAMPNVDLWPMLDRPHTWEALLWRFFALHDDDAEAVMFRDCDSRPDGREKAAVDEWLESGRSFHIMRDHPAHTAPILAGLWGCTRAGAAKVSPLLGRGPSSFWFADQVWLADYVYKVTIGDALIHDSAARFSDETTHPFTVPRTELPAGGWRFVGQGFDEHEQPRIPADALRVTP